MKTTGFLFGLLLLMSSCVDYYEEPRYDHRDKVLGYYDVEEYSDTYDDYLSYELYVSKSAYSGNEIYLNNFYDEDLGVYARLYDNSITIPLQVHNGFEIEGSGTWYRGRLELEYRVRDLYGNGLWDYCETVAYLR